MPQPTPIILDTDIGDDIDDAFALGLILQSPELELIGVTTVFGDTAKRARIALAVLDAFGRRDVPVAVGVGKPLVAAAPHRDPQHYRGIDPSLKLPAPHPRHALPFLIEKLEASNQSVTLCPVGPLTNVGLLLAARPDLAERVNIVLMGGMFAGQRREYNIASDAEAARIVFASGASITAVGLDVTLQCQMTDAQVNQIAQAGHASTCLISKLTAIWQQETLRPPILHDPLAVAMCFDPTFCRTEPMRVEVETNGRLTGGLTVAAPDAKSRTRVCTQVDAKRFIATVLDRVCAPPRKAAAR